MHRTIATLTLPMYRLYWRVWRPKTTRVRAVVTHGSQVLLVRHIQKSYWNIPSGKVEKGETLMQALARELKEELGIKTFRTHGLLGTYRHKTRTRDDTAYVFAVEVPTSTIPYRQWELDGAGWFGMSHLPNTIESGAARRIREHQNGERELHRVW